MTRAQVARWCVGLCLLLAAAAPAPARAEGKAIVEVRLLAPEPAADGAWLVQVEEVLNGFLPGSVVAVAGLSPGMVAQGEAGERLRLVLAPGDGRTYRVLSAHLSPEVDPALADPEPPPLAVTPPDAGAAGPDRGLAPKAAPTPSYEQQVVELVNEERWNHGQLPPLKQADALHSSSGTHSSNMATRDFFAHCDPDTRTSPLARMSAAGYAAVSAGENIAAGYADPAAVMAGWMGSSGHRANILTTFRYEIGVGYVRQADDQATVRFDQNGDCTADSFGNGPYFRYWTQNFGRRSNVFPVVIEREALSTSSATVDLYVYGAGWAQEMRFSNDGSTWSAWETYDPNKTWTLPGGAGTKTVHAQLRSGSTILQASDTIYLDSPCTAEQTVDVPNETVSGEARWEACDTVSAVSGFTVGGAGGVTFQAGRRVVLGDGFAVLAGGTFTAVIAMPP